MAGTAFSVRLFNTNLYHFKEQHHGASNCRITTNPANRGPLFYKLLSSSLISCFSMKDKFHKIKSIRQETPMNLLLRIVPFCHWYSSPDSSSLHNSLIKYINHT